MLSPSAKAKLTPELLAELEEELEILSKYHRLKSLCGEALYTLSVNTLREGTQKLPIADLRPLVEKWVQQYEDLVGKPEIIITPALFLDPEKNT